jgi:hypothetical protein
MPLFENKRDDMSILENSHGHWQDPKFGVKIQNLA